jgi:hypothetical protein
MLVSKYPHWVATIVYQDGHAHHFDGAKDMFKFWFEPAKYAAGHSREQPALRPGDQGTTVPTRRGQVLGSFAGRVSSRP